MSMIPNPQKSVVVDFPIPDIKIALSKIPKYYNNKYTLESQNDLLNQFTFGALEFLSLGVYIDVNLNYVADTKTNIVVEVKRKMGAFDRSLEVQKANTHIANIFNGLSTLLTNIKKQAVSIEVDNPTQTVVYDLPWEDFKEHLNTFVSKYHSVYKAEESLSDSIVLRRKPQKADDVVLDIDAIIKINSISSSNSSSSVQYEITNDNNKIATQGELQRNGLILKITINLIQKIIDELKNGIFKAEGELKNLEKWKMGRSEAVKQEQINSQLKLIADLKRRLRPSVLVS